MKLVHALVLGSSFLLGACHTYPIAAGGPGRTLPLARCAPLARQAALADTPMTRNIAAMLEDPTDGCLGRTLSDALAAPQVRAVEKLRHPSADAGLPQGSSTQVGARTDPERMTP